MTGGNGEGWRSPGPSCTRRYPCCTSSGRGLLVTVINASVRRVVLSLASDRTSRSPPAPIAPPPLRLHRPQNLQQSLSLHQTTLLLVRRSSWEMRFRRVFYGAVVGSGTHGRSGSAGASAANVDLNTAIQNGLKSLKKVMNVRADEPDMMDLKKINSQQRGSIVSTLRSALEKRRFVLSQEVAVLRRPPPRMDVSSTLYSLCRISRKKTRTKLLAPDLTAIGIELCQMVKLYDHP